MRRGAVALALACGAGGGALVLASGCGADEASRPEPSSPASLPSPARPRRPPPALAADLPDASPDRWAGDGTKVRTPPPPAPLPEPMFGAAESARPGDAHAFRLAVSLRAMRWGRSGARVLKMLSVLPAVIEAKARTGVDPFADGEWLLVYGSKVAVPGPNANVVKHARSEADVSRSLADAGLEAGDAGPGRDAFRADIYGVRDVLVRPQPGVIAVVPADRAGELATALASKALEPGVKPGELARIFVAEPASLARFLPREIVRANVIVKAAPDGGLDADAEADCPDVASCKATAASLDELATKQNGLVVRILLKNLLANLAVRADAVKLKVTLHASPEQVDAVLDLARGQLGLPAEERDGGAPP